MKLYPRDEQSSHGSSASVISFTVPCSRYLHSPRCFWEATNVNDSTSEIDRLLRDLREVERALATAFMEEAAGWGVGVGPIRIQGIFTPELITIIFVVFNALCFVLGVVFSLLGGTLSSLGVSLVVGSIFAVSAFVAQLWAVSYQRAKEVRRKVFGDDLEKLRDLAGERANILEQIKEMSGQLDQTSGDLNNPE